MSNNRPAWLDSDDYASYKRIVESWGFEVVNFETFGSYQGDHLALLRSQNGIGWGLIVFGYGSCSGCDQLEGIESSIGYHYSGDDEPDTRDWTPLIEFADSLREEVHWEATKDALREWIDSNPEASWWRFDEEIARWLNANLGTNLQKGMDDE